MNQPVFLTRDAFDCLLANLLDIEENKYQIMDDFCSGLTKESEEVKRILNDYVGRVTETIKCISTLETANNDFPYVIIGCEVVIEDIDNHITDRYKVISPNKNNINFNEISFLSPLGKALLLKKIGDYFTVEAPGGNFHYKVLSVKVTTDPKSPRFNFQWLKGRV